MKYFLFLSLQQNEYHCVIELEIWAPFDALKETFQVIKIIHVAHLHNLCKIC